MKRIVKIGIAVVAAIVMMGVVSCGGGNNPPPAGDDATLVSVKFGTETATLGTPGATFATAVAGSVTILQAAVNITATPTSDDAELLYAKVDSDGKYTNTDGDLVDFDDDALWYDTAFEFETGDQLVIKVTHNTAVKYYKIAVTHVKVALATLKVGDFDVTLPAGGTTWQTAGSGGFVLFTYLVTEQPTGGITIVATAREDGDEDVTITFGKAVGDAQPTFGESSSFSFVDNEFLYIKVTGNDSGATAYYKVKINFKRDGRIKYGSPKIGYGTDGSDRGTNGLPSTAGTAGYIDPLWNDAALEVYPIDRIYAADSGSYLDPSNHYPETIATAKVLWDEEGLSVYVKVIDADVSSVDNEHNKDSFELFINEDLTGTGTGAQKYSNGGSQYRVAANGQRSGEGGSPAAMNLLNKTTGWKTDDGYIVIMKAPWRLRNKFFSPTTYRNDWNFGFELQINASGVTETRYAVLVWNNIAHTNYQNAADYGNAKLYGQPDTLNYPALPPVIDTQPQGVVISSQTSVDVTVTASTKDAGALSYQWYSATSPTADGTIIAGATTMTYSITTIPTETTYYYAVVTNTLAGTTATTTSARARITIPTVPQLDIFALKQTNPVYKFTLPAGATFGDYYAISIQVKMDATNLAKGIRSLRLMGNYAAEKFSAHSSGYNFFGFGDANAAYIYDDLGAGYINDATTGVGNGKADQWFTVTYKLVDNVPNSGFLAANKPESTATGPFLFGVGVPGNDGAATNAITQSIKGITMLHKTDASKNVVTTDFFGFVGYDGASGMDDTTMSQIPDPEYVAGSETFYMNLSNILTTGYSDTSNPFIYNSGTVTNGVLTATMAGETNANFDRLAIGFTDEQITKIKGASSVKITVDASATPDIQCRYHIGLVTAGSAWNATDAVGPGAFNATIPGTKTLAISTPDRVVCLIFNSREKTAATITIKSITVTTIP